MKKIIIGLVALCCFGTSYAQKDLIGAMFEKYTGKEGYTTVNITGDMLKLITQAEEQRRDTLITSKLSELRILTLDNDCDKTASIDFKTELFDKLDKAIYKEMMTVRQIDENVDILIKESNGRIAEMLIVVDGKDDKVLIQVKGDILMSELTEMASRYQMKGFEHLKKLEE
jgi:hypothetical protein